MRAIPPSHEPGTISRDAIRQAKAKLDSVISRVCGACELNCCLQGTMAGSDDARRIAKVARRSPEFRDHLVAEMRARSVELRRDLDGLGAAARLLTLRFEGERDADLAQLDGALARWRGFCDFLDSEFACQADDVIRCLMFTAIRATALRAMEAFPGGANVLPSLAGVGTSFEIGKRGIKPDRCLFHRGGCVVAEAKPHKCADFYCATQPGLIGEVAEAMTADEFVLAHFRPRTLPEFRTDLRVELELGRDYIEPKVIVGGGDLADGLAGELREDFDEVAERSIEGGHLDVQVDVPANARTSEAVPLVMRCGSVDAVAVYELAVLVVRARGETHHPLIVVVADAWRPTAGSEHTLWRDRAISQPLSAIELVALVDE